MEVRAVTVVDEPANSRFVVADPDIEAELNYRLTGDRLTMRRTYTAPEHRGQGIAGQLVAAAVERAKENGETVVPACWYVREWLEANPDAAEGLKIDS